MYSVNFDIINEIDKNSTQLGIDKKNIYLQFQPMCTAVFSTTSHSIHPSSRIEKLILAALFCFVLFFYQSKYENIVIH